MTVDMYDVIIVGARCAGSPTAMLLARQGYRVLVVDRATFPSDIMSGHHIHQHGIVLLQQWGLLDLVVASNCPPIREVRFDYGEGEFVAKNIPVEGVAECYGVRRKYLDKILVDAAQQAGAEVREGFLVQEILMEGDRVTGIRGRKKNGEVLTAKAPIVIGADGMNSLVARSVDAPFYNTRPTLAGGYYSYWSNLPIDIGDGEVFIRDGRFISTQPTNDGLTQIFVEFPQQEFQSFRTDVEGNFLKALDLVPDLAVRVKNAQRQEPFVGTSNNTNYFRKAFGSGWALAGDARYHRDALTAQGITNSFQDAQRLAQAIDAGLCGNQLLEVALSAYESERNAQVMPMYDLTCQLAALQPPPPPMLELFHALKSNPEAASRFVGVVGGTVPVSEFYSPQNIESIVGAPKIERSVVLSA